MNKDIGFYIKKYKKFDESQCDILLNDVSCRNFQEHQTADYNDNFTIVENQPLTYVGLLNTHNHKMMIDGFWECLTQYMKDIDIPWFAGWNGFSTPKHIRYNVGAKMNTHCDHIYSLFEKDSNPRGVPTLTMLLLLNDDFEGGEFEMFGDNIYKMGRGDVLIFPSNFLYPHSIKPITKGVRNSVISWVY